MQSKLGWALGFVMCGLVAVPIPAHAHNKIGVTLDVGVPDGATAALVYRPYEKLRLHAGGSFNLVGPGVRVGATVSPFFFWFTPTLSLEAGRYFESNANRTVNWFSDDEEPSDIPILRRVGYDYGNAHLGLEFGVRRVTFYLHGGLSIVRTTLHNLGEHEELEPGEDAGDTTVEIREDPRVTVIGPSARIGFIVFF